LKELELADTDLGTIIAAIIAAPIVVFMLYIIIKALLGAL